MKKVLNTVLIISAACLIQSCYSEDWDSYSNLDRAWDGQKTISNQDFEKVMDKLQEKTKKREARKKRRKAKKISGGGTSLHNELNPEKIIPELESVKPASEDLLINVHVNLITDNGILEKGYYNVVGERSKEDGKLYLMFYQAHYLKAKIPMNETEDDYGEEDVNFVKIKNYNDSFVKLIFGSVDFNAYTYIPFNED